MLESLGLACGDRRWGFGRTIFEYGLACVDVEGQPMILFACGCGGPAEAPSIAFMERRLFTVTFLTMWHAFAAWVNRGRKWEAVYPVLGFSNAPGPTVIAPF